MTFGKQVLNFNLSLNPHFKVSKGVHVLHPYSDKHITGFAEQFYSNYYNDHEKRVFIFGINPGRFGAGTTGIPFTDPIRLERECGIANDLKKLPELSSAFIYQLIHEYGGVNLFYSHFYITAVCPLGFTYANKNLNYYDDKQLYSACTPMIIESIDKQLVFGADRNYCFCLGEGKNFDCLDELNKEHTFFKKIIPLPHPRWIMQYRRKYVSLFIQKYLDAFKNC